MKKSIAIASACTALFSFGSTTDASTKDMTATANLNVRTKPSTNATILGTLKKQTTIQVQSIENGWGKIQYKGQTAYVSATYLKDKAPSQNNGDSQVDVTTKEYIVTATSLNVRNKANTSGRVIGKVTKNQKLNVIQKESNGWYKIKLGTQTGYVSGDYVTVKNVSVTPEPEKPSEPTPPVDTTKEYIVTATSLNVRSKASTSGSIIGSVTKNQKLNVIQKESNGWYKIKLGTQTGYVSGDYVTVKDVTTTPEEPTPPVDTTKEYIVTATSLNVRNQANTSGRVIGKVTKNQKLNVIQKESNGWYKIKLGTQTGYVSGDYVAVRDTTTTPELPTQIEGILKGRIIVLDPGHGGHDPGAVNENGVLEKNIVLNVARFAKPLLEKLGANVILTRSGDSYLTLSERTKIAENAKADAFLSLHANAATNSSASGLETWYSTTSRTYMAPSERDEKSKLLALYVQEELVKELGLTDRGIKDGNFYVIANTKSMPSALTELGFVSNEKESLFIDDTDVQKRMAAAITRGFIRLFVTY